MIQVVGIIVLVLLLLGVLGHAFPSPPHSSPRPMGVPSTDLRISEFAPDLSKANTSKSEWDAGASSRRREEHYKLMRDISEMTNEIRINARVEAWKRGEPVD